MTSLTEHYSDGVLMNANRMVKLGHVHRDEEDPNKFKVKGSKFYTVRRISLGLDEDGQPVSDDGMPYVTCDCPNGLARGGRPNCKHSAAVIITLQKEVEDLETIIVDSYPSEREALEDEYAAGNGMLSPGWTGHD